MAGLLYPTHSSGLAVSPWEILLPPTEIPPDLLDQGSPYTNMHHRYYYKKRYAGSLLLRTFVMLEANIDEIPIDQHNYLHDTYRGGVLPPSVDTMLEIVVEAELTGARIQKSRKEPRVFMPIPHGVIDTILDELGATEEGY